MNIRYKKDFNKSKCVEAYSKSVFQMSDLNTILYNKLYSADKTCYGDKSKPYQQATTNNLWKSAKNSKAETLETSVNCAISELNDKERKHEAPLAKSVSAPASLIVRRSTSSASAINQLPFAGLVAYHNTKLQRKIEFGAS